MVIAVDFDGTITKKAVWPDIGEPNSEVIEMLRQWQREGHHLILWTCRTDEDLKAAVEFCKRYKLTFDAVNDNVPHIQAKGWGTGRKIYADFYFDDLATSSPQELRRWIKEREATHGA